MPAITRQVGTTSEYLMVFIPDATVSTGVGLANINATNVTMAWYRSDMAAVSTQTLSNGTLGTWAASTFAQALSNGALGWYGVSIPNGVFVSGRSAMVHLAGAPSMAPVPILVELTKTDNQTYFSSQTLSTNQLVNVNQILGSTPVTSAAGEMAARWDLGRTANLTSTVALTGLSSAYVTTVGSATANVTQILGSTPVTTAAGVVATAWDLGRTANLTSTVALPGFSIGFVTTVNVSVSDVNVVTILGSTPVTTAAGVLATAWDLGRTANLTSTVALTGLSVLYTSTAGVVTGLTPSLLDVSVSSRLPTASYTTPPTVAQITTGVLATAMGESYRAIGATGTVAQVLYELLGHHNEAAISGTTKTINKIDQLTAAATFTLDSSTAPAAITRST